MSPRVEPTTEQLLERLRAARRRAVLVALCACFLALGVLFGVYLAHRPATVKATDRSPRSELSAAFVEVARMVEPAVVNVSTVTQPARTPRSPNEFSLSRPSIGELDPEGPEPARRGNGSGVIVDESGYILTNHHVIAGADRIKAKLWNGIELPARLIGSDRETDLAVIKIEGAKPFQSARLGDSEKMQVGEWVLAIGSPFGLDQTVTAGIISTRERDSLDLYKRVGFQYFLQTDAAINRGNSGGPLINLDGEVIGINTAIATSTGDYNGVCFALPSSEAIQIYKQLVKDGRVVRGFLGALTDPVTPQIAKVYGLKVARGAIVSNISETMELDGAVVASPAAKAGLRVNDIIIEFRGAPIKDDAELIRRAAATPVGTSAVMKVIRNTNELELTVIIGRRPSREPVKRAEVQARMLGDESAKSPGLGMSIQALTAQRSRERDLDITRGVSVIRVEPGGVADDANVRVGDIIEAINRQPVASNEDFKRIIGGLKSGDPIVLQVYREKLAPLTRIFLSLDKP